VVGDQADVHCGGHRGACQSGVRVAAAWAIAKFEFKGKSLLITLIDLPFASVRWCPAWCMCCCSARRLVRPWLQAHDIKLIFAVPGIVLATIFVTFRSSHAN